MSTINLIQGSCVEQKVDAIVNAANKYLMSGGGICGAIFQKAGYLELNEACQKINTPLQDGNAIITPSFNIKNTKAIIHAVGPNFSVTPNAFKELFNAYYNSLNLLKENNYHTIAFPLISSGIFGTNLENPVEVSTIQCIKAYQTFIKNNPNYEINVLLCAYTTKEYQEASKLFNN